MTSQTTQNVEIKAEIYTTFSDMCTTKDNIIICTLDIRFFESNHMIGGL